MRQDKLINRYLSYDGKEVTLTQVKSLHLQACRCLKSHDTERVRTIEERTKKVLKYMEKAKAKKVLVELDEEVVKTLREYSNPEGLGKLDLEESGSVDDVQWMSLESAATKKHNMVKLPHPWNEVLGQFANPTSLMLVGKGGSGKSGSMLKLAEYFTQQGLRVLFASPEQFHSPTFPVLIKDAGIKWPNPNIVVSTGWSDDHPQINPANYDIIVIDSKDRFKWNPDDLLAFQKKYPHATVIMMSHSNKDGAYRGEGPWQNEVDCWVEFYKKQNEETGKMEFWARTINKNRWGTWGDVKNFDSKD